ncbi:hypothetical protein E3N88_06440 [Mikania micrantha]|uniref:Ubiquitin-like protease family profile domain-containing protein n=1 Tax=Mikania micrantha TaxID=192012 RepID=A0A5N6PNP7_9ASTR|nr:hypothetical protein E3N88_06440 [Mikania micrantha]
MADEETPGSSTWRKNPGKARKSERILMNRAFSKFTNEPGNPVVLDAEEGVAQQECVQLINSSPRITKSDARRKMPDVPGEVATKAIQQETSPTTHSSPKITKAAARRILPDLHNKVDTTGGTSSLQVTRTTIDNVQTDKPEKSTDKAVIGYKRRKTIAKRLKDPVTQEPNIVTQQVSTNSDDDFVCPPPAGSVSLIPTVVIDEFIEGLLTPDPTNSPAGLSTCSPFYGGAHQGQPQNQMEWKCLINNKMKKLDDLVSEIERNFNEAFVNYPDDDGIKDAMVAWRNKLQKFGKHMGDDHATHSDKDPNLGGNTKDPFDSTQYNISCSMMDELEKSVLSKYDGPNEKGKTRCDIGVSNDVPSFDLMLSQLTPVDPAHVDPVHVDPIHVNPSHVRPSPDKPAQPFVTNTDTEPHPKQRRNLRVVKLPEILRSPFVQKKVSLGVKRSKLEDNVASTIFCANKDDCNFVFESTRSGDAVTRVTFESLYPGIDLHVSVLNCWVDVLNSEDQYINNSDPKRLFTPCLMLVDSHYKDDVEEVNRITSFTENMENCLKSAGLDSLIGVDLLFIPMLHACHYYVICFNLKKAHVYVIDNLGTNVDFDIKYANRPQIMLPGYDITSNCIYHEDM